MTEVNWLACSEPRRMLEFLADRASERKLCLFAVACRRRNWHRLDDPTRRALEIGERYAEGKATLWDVRAVSGHYLVGFLGEQNIGIEGASFVANDVGWDIAFADAAERFPDTVEDPYAPANKAGRAAETDGYVAEQGVQCHLLRDVFGPLAFRQVTLGPAVLAWNQGTVRRLAESVYEERVLPAGTLDAVSLAILADALLDAGCDNEDLIAHCRSEGPHVRGCWAVDIVLGKG